VGLGAPVVLSTAGVSLESWRPDWHCNSFGICGCRAIVIVVVHRQRDSNRWRVQHQRLCAISILLRSSAARRELAHVSARQARYQASNRETWRFTDPASRASASIKAEMTIRRDGLIKERQEVVKQWEADVRNFRIELRKY
jgi:hypothetical protein